MAGINKAIIVGNLGQDPEIRYMQDGTAVTTFRIATSENWNDKQTGEKREKTEWHRIVAWGRLGEICGQYLSKGRQVYVEGKLQTRSWEQDGITRYMTEIVANTVQFLGNREEGGARPRPAERPMSAPGNQMVDQGYPSPPVPNHQEDDIPF